MAVAAGNEMFVSRNSPVAEMNLFCFLLILVYLNSEEFDCEWGGGGAERFLFQIRSLLPGLFWDGSTALKNFFFFV